MKYTRFEELPVWNSAIDLALQIYTFTQDPAWAGRGSLKDQLERATVSISNNVAEGFERGTKQELLTFLYIARGSAAEVRSMLILLEKMDCFSNSKFKISNLRLLAENIARQLGGWTSKLQNMPVEGRRYVTEKTRRNEKLRHDRDEFLVELKKNQASAGKGE